MRSRYALYALSFYKFFTIVFLLFQLPDFLSQVKDALGLPSASGAPVAGPIAGPSNAHTIPVAASGPSCIAPAAAPSGPPPIVLEDSDSESGVQILAVPFRSGSSDAYLPMISTDDSWFSDTEFRYYLFL